VSIVVGGCVHCSVSFSRAGCLSLVFVLTGCHAMPPLCLQHGSVGGERAWPAGLYVRLYRALSSDLRLRCVDERRSEICTDATNARSFAAAISRGSVAVAAAADLAMGPAMHVASRWCPCAL
jgi:hypothetical protein